MIAVDANLVAVLKVRIVERLDEIETLVKQKDLIAGRNEYVVLEKSDTTKSSVPASSRPVYIHPVPVNGFEHGPAFGVDEVNAAMTFALLASPDDRCGNESGHRVLPDAT